MCSLRVRNSSEKRGVKLQVDVGVIGAGPAGLAAAIKARELGVENVVIFERKETLGGVLDQCIHNGFGLLYFGEDMTGPEYAHRFIEKTKELGVNFKLDTMVLGITPDKKITASNSKEGVLNIDAKAIILAMGCRERSRGAIRVPGERPSGIFTAGTAQRLLNIEGFLPGKKIVILGSGDIGMIMARRLTLEGAEVVAVIEILPYVGGLIRNEVQCLHDFDIPLFLSHTVTDIHGDKRVEAVTISKVDEEFNPIPGTERRIECDTLLLSVGLIPENELSEMAGVKLDPVIKGPIVDERMETSVPGIFAAGNVVHVNDLVDEVTWQAELAGSSAAEYVLGKAKPIERRIDLKAGENIRYVVPQTVSGERNVTIYARVRKPESNVLLKVGNIHEKAYRFVKPSEMLKAELSAEQLGKLEKDVKEVEVSCIKRG